MKVKMEVNFNNKISCSEIDYKDFSIETITNRLNKLPNFKPNLVEFNQEDNHHESFSTMKLKYCNLSKSTDSVIVRIIPLFNVIESIMSKAS